MKHSYLMRTLVILFFPITAIAETYQMEKMVKSATRTLKAGSHVPQSIDRLDNRTLLHQNLRNIPDAMKSIPGTMAQKTAHGQGSPYIRGFTGFRTLYLIDGIRLNNSIFRSGPNEYSNLIDTYSLASLEIAKGPASVLFGSDAIGGAVLATTQKKSFINGPQSQLKTLLRVAEGENSAIGRISWGQVISNNTNYHLGFTYKDFGELRPGSGEKRLKHTDYSEMDYDFSIEQKIATGTLRIYHQSVDQNDVWRTHKTIFSRSYKGTSIGKENQRLKDLDRSLTYLRYKNQFQQGLVNRLEATISYQTLTEEQDRIKSSLKRDLQAIAVHTTGIQIQLDSISNDHEITYGIDGYRDLIDSRKESFNTDGTSSGLSIQGPVADDSTYTSLGFYIQDFYLVTPQTSTIFGLRHNHITAEIGRYEDPTDSTAKSMDKTYDGTIGSLKILHSLDENGAYNIYASISQGFRAPNLSDLTRLDDSRSNFEEIPSQGLSPETFNTFELGFKIAKADVASQIAVYQTDVSDMIIRKPVSTGQNGEILTEKRNGGYGYIRGLELDLEGKISSAITMRFYHVKMQSDIASYPDASETRRKAPHSRLMPDNTKLIFSYDSPMAKITASLTHVEDQQDLSFGDMLDTQRIPPGGTPGYDTLDLKFSHRLIFINAETWAHVAIENVTDENYRVHGSGQNEVGRNLIVTLEGQF